MWVKPVPRYWDLLQKRGVDLKTVDLERAQAQFSAQELRDAQVHFLIGWMGFCARHEEPLVADLAARERGFSEADKLELLEASRRIALRICATSRSSLHWLPCLSSRSHPRLIA